MFGEPSLPNLIFSDLHIVTILYLHPTNYGKVIIYFKSAKSRVKKIITIDQDQIKEISNQYSSTKNFYIDIPSSLILKEAIKFESKS